MSDNIEDIRKSLTERNYQQFLILLRDFTLFSFMGSGVNFVLPSAVYQEVPYFEDHLPEKMCIATYLNLANAMGLITMLSYLYYNDYVHNIPYTTSVPTMLVTSAVMSFIAAFVYHYSVVNVSLPLYICLFIAGSVGSCSSIIMSPFMAQYTNDNISACRTGGSGGALLCAIVSAIQQPGSNSQRFSVTIYLVIFGILLSFAIPSYMHIIKNKIGLRGPQVSDQDFEISKISGTNELIQAANNNNNNNNFHVNPILLDHQNDGSQSPSLYQGLDNSSPISLKNNNNINNNNTNNNLESSINSNITTGDDWKKQKHGTSLFGYKLSGIMETIANYVISDTYNEQYPWLRPVVPYMLTVGWINFNTWGIISAIIPFAIANAYDSEGAGYLNVALVVGAICLVAGDISTVFFHLRLLQGTIVFSILCFILYIATFHITGFYSTVSGPIIVIIYGSCRFIEAHLVTTSLRAVATEFPLSYRESASKFIGISNQMCSTIGAIFSTIIVVSLLSC